MPEAFHMVLCFPSCLPCTPSLWNRLSSLVAHFHCYFSGPSPSTEKAGTVASTVWKRSSYLLSLFVLGRSFCQESWKWKNRKQGANKKTKLYEDGSGIVKLFEMVFLIEIQLASFNTQDLVWHTQLCRLPRQDTAEFLAPQSASVQSPDSS